METLEYRGFDPEKYLLGVCDICRELGWDNFHYDPELTRKSLTAPGVTAIVAVYGSDEVVGFAQVQGDGVGLQTHLSLLAVRDGWRRKGIARGLVEEAFRGVGASRMDLIASDESLDFYRSLRHREQVGFRLYPAREDNEQEA